MPRKATPKKKEKRKKAQHPAHERGLFTSPLFSSLIGETEFS